MLKFMALICPIQLANTVGMSGMMKIQTEKGVPTVLIKYRPHQKDMKEQMKNGLL